MIRLAYADYNRSLISLGLSVSYVAFASIKVSSACHITGHADGVVLTMGVITFLEFSKGFII